MKFIIHILVLALGFSLAWGQEDAPQTAPEKKAAMLVDLKEPAFPPALVYEGVSEGQTRVLVSINAEGNVQDWIPLRSTRKEFIKPIDRVIYDWKFEPARINGEPSRIVQKFDINWNSNGQFSIINSSRAAQILYLTQGDDYEYEVAKVSELDTIPEPVEIVEPKVPAVGNGIEEREITFYFYIDEEGNVRMPAVNQSDIPIPQAMAIAEAIEQWKFKPPMVNGKPVVVQVAQSFVIRE